MVGSRSFDPTNILQIKLGAECIHVVPKSRRGRSRDRRDRPRRVPWFYCSMGVRDEIFPSDRQLGYVQTEWARGWGYAITGFGKAARMLTERRAEMHASVDQIGLAIFYLQRHRVELVIKEALLDLGEAPEQVTKRGHNLARLWARLGTIVRAKGDDHWASLDGDYGEFVQVMHDADRGSFSYRYPIDTAGRESERAPFLDLDALEQHAERFERHVSGYVGWVSETEDPADYR